MCWQCGHRLPEAIPAPTVIVQGILDRISIVTLSVTGCTICLNIAVRLVRKEVVLDS